VNQFVNFGRWIVFATLDGFLFTASSILQRGIKIFLQRLK